jgi:hypothetical protein
MGITELNSAAFVGRGAYFILHTASAPCSGGLSWTPRRKLYYRNSYMHEVRQSVRAIRGCHGGFDFFLSEKSAERSTYRTRDSQISISSSRAVTSSLSFSVKVSLIRRFEFSDDFAHSPVNHMLVMCQHHVKGQEKSSSKSLCLRFLRVPTKIGGTTNGNW